MKMYFYIILLKKKRVPSLEIIFGYSKNARMKHSGRRRIYFKIVYRNANFYFRTTHVTTPHKKHNKNLTYGKPRTPIFTGKKFFYYLPPWSRLTPSLIHRRKYELATPKEFRKFIIIAVYLHSFRWPIFGIFNRLPRNKQLVCLFIGKSAKTHSKYILHFKIFEEFAKNNLHVIEAINLVDSLRRMRGNNFRFPAMFVWHSKLYSIQTFFNSVLKIHGNLN